MLFTVWVCASQTNCLERFSSYLHWDTLKYALMTRQSSSKHFQPAAEAHWVHELVRHSGINLTKWKKEKACIKRDQWPFLKLFLMTSTVFPVCQTCDTQHQEPEQKGRWERNTTPFCASSERMITAYLSISKLSSSWGLQKERYVVRKVRTKLGSVETEYKNTVSRALWVGKRQNW